MKVNKFEAGGIALSIAAMALALFLLRVDNVTNGTSEEEVDQNSIVLAEGVSQQAALGSAFSSAAPEGKLEKMIVNDVILGEGDEVKEGDTVEVNYIGTLQNGQQFDNSYQKGQSFTFTVGEGKVIAGWDEGIVGMKVGGQRVLVIPPEMAYGSKGYGPIPKNATLVFIIELVAIK